MKIVYWITTGLVAASLIMAVTYILGGKEAAEGFDKIGYPQHLRIVLGFAKPLAGIVLLMPGMARLKEWAYAGVTFAWIMATIANKAAGLPEWFMPPILLLLRLVSYATRPLSRRVSGCRTEPTPTGARRSRAARSLLPAPHEAVRELRAAIALVCQLRDQQREG